MPNVMRMQSQQINISCYVQFYFSVEDSYLGKIRCRDMLVMIFC